MNHVIISVQHGDPRKQTYLRKEIGVFNKRSVLDAVEEMLDDQEAHTIGKFKPTFKGYKKQPAKKPDDEVMPGAAVTEKVDRALEELAAA